MSPSSMGSEDGGQQISLRRGTISFSVMVSVG